MEAGNAQVVIALRAQLVMVTTESFVSMNCGRCPLKNFQNAIHHIRDSTQNTLGNIRGADTHRGPHVRSLEPRRSVESLSSQTRSIESGNFS